MVLKSGGRYHYCLLLWVVYWFSSCKGHQEYSDPLTRIYLNYNEEPGFDHWIGYGRRYHEHFKHFFKRQDGMKKKIQMLEIGVQSGGSTRVWSQYFGENLNYTGLDINPNCTQFEMPEKGIHILTGSQMDEQLLQRICRDYGPFDIIIDDGGHTSEMIMRSFNILFGCMHDGGVYAMEDLHTMIMWKSNTYQGKDVYEHLGDLSRQMVKYWKNRKNLKAIPEEETNEETLASHIASISIYDSLAFIHYQSQWKPMQNIKRGSLWIPYKEKKSSKSYWFWPA